MTQVTKCTGVIEHITLSVSYITSFFVERLHTHGRGGRIGAIFFSQIQKLIQLARFLLHSGCHAPAWPGESDVRKAIGATKKKVKSHDQQKTDNRCRKRCRACPRPDIGIVVCISDQSTNLRVEIRRSGTQLRRRCGSNRQSQRRSVSLPPDRLFLRQGRRRRRRYAGGTVLDDSGNFKILELE